MVQSSETSRKIRLKLVRNSHRKKRIVIHATPNRVMNVEVLAPDPFKGHL